MSALHRTVRRLAEELRCAEQISRCSAERLHFSTGIPPLDALLPGGGLCRGMLLEWLPAADEGSGATLMGLLTARSFADCGLRIAELEDGSISIRNPKSEIRNPIVVIDRCGTFYPPAAAAWGIPLADMILLRPANARDEAWALDQAIRSPAVAAVLAWPTRLDGRAFRRLQLAAESSGAIGILVRPASARREPTWADVRFCAGPLCHSGPGNGDFRFQISDFRLAEDRGWQLCIERLHARGCVHPETAVHIEITSEGQILEVAPAAHALIETHAHDQSAICNLKSAI
jgi:hypothetical protein